ncbi:TPA: hypothetical protein SIA39_004039 [Aeromonas sobria]|nr:hypothetical protein [Aeromonas sobria]HEH9441968.1 hypothetical protein [Aeromonas sobria]
MTHDIVAAEVPLENVHDVEVVPTLLNPQRRKLGYVYTDSAYDSKASNQLISRKGGGSLYPTPLESRVMEKGTPRNEAVLVMCRKDWRMGRKYRDTTVARWQKRQCIGSSSFWGKISLRKYNGQIWERMVYLAP